MKRVKRLESLLKDEISSILKVKVNDDRIGFISITDIKISKDRNDAWVYYSQIGTDEQKAKCRKGLSSATKFIHSEICKNIRYMIIPKIHFRFDNSLERGVDLVNKINNLSDE
ncbi:30S ribosome-binding factor RbfA [Candidatus Marinamargulisbacteria bacterium SCGC AG-414-C22]|nr:30S ribosome-binding factor RbfA [Candidatus Marinamargulisbacteria bacterium SCGC AG-414-C22]